MKYLILSLSLLISSLSLNASECVNISSNNCPRICQLIPQGWLKFPSIDPAIPSDYTMGSNEKNFKYARNANAVLWGKEADLEGFLKDRSFPISSAIFMVRHSYDVAQTGVNSFSGEENLHDQYIQGGFKDVNIEKLNWGSYPVIVIESTWPNGVPSYCAWIGLNDDGCVLMVMLIPSSSQTRLETVNIWKTFIQKTKQLDEPAFGSLKQSPRIGV